MAYLCGIVPILSFNRPLSGIRHPNNSIWADVAQIKIVFTFNVSASSATDKVSEH